MHNVFRDFIQSIFPQENYLTFREGNSPIILSAPHGGNTQPISIPKRTWGNRSRDTYTRRLTQLIIENLQPKPYFIYSDIHRNRVDLNRDIEEATQGNKRAERIWEHWNEQLTRYTNHVSKKYGKVLYIDIHSHNNSNMFQVGYGLKVKDYNDVMSGWQIKNKSTMYAFNGELNEFPALFGDYSFPESISNFGFEVLRPSNDKSYLNGGRNIQHFSSELVGAIQIECPIPVLRNDLDKVANCLIYGINRFKEKFLE